MFSKHIKFVVGNGTRPVLPYQILWRLTFKTFSVCFGFK